MLARAGVQVGSVGSGARPGVTVGAQCLVQSRTAVASSSLFRRFSKPVSRTRQHLVRVAEADTATRDATAAAPAPESDGRLNFFKQWYPVSATDSLDPKRPMNLALCGIEMVIWSDGKAWHCMEDKCSHRLAPLSEGRITPEGNLACSYHGWEFSGTGKLEKVPQIERDPLSNEEVMNRACSSKCASVRAFPIKVEKSVVWVWPDSGLEALAESSKTAGAMHPDVAIPGFAEGEWELVGTPYMRDVPLRYDTLMENVVDPSHVPFSHHGVQGNRTKIPLTAYKRLGEITPAGFEVEMTRTMGGPAGNGAATSDKDASPTTTVGVMKFIAPSLVVYSGPGLAAYFQAQPTRVGWSRVVGLFCTKKKPNDWKAPVMNWLLGKFAALDHALNRNEVIDGDTYFLHVSERVLLRGGNNWKRDYYMPASADIGVVAFRKWLEGHAEEAPTLVGSVAEMPPQMPREQVLNRYDQHVKGCKHCLNAIKTIDRARMLFAAASAAAAVVLLATVIASKPLLTVGNGALAVAMALGALLVSKLGGLREKFFYTDYVHAAK